MLKSILLLFCAGLLVSCTNTNFQDISDDFSSDISMQAQEQRFISTGLQTDTSIASIDIEQVLGGGPAKDGIPAINNPKFLDIKSAKAAMEYLTPDEMGLSIDIDGEQRFYPYAILVWHEIANDSIADNHFSVTFCPLCGSGIVFNRELETGIVNFGVSGKLYQSNLLMYDDDTETLWSQTLGEAVVGEKTGQKLEVLKTNLMSFEQFETLYPDGVVLSDDTGHSRNYGFVPYGGYDESDTLYFPVDNDDTRLHKKEILYVANDTENNTSVAFVLKDLVSQGSAILEVDEKLYTAVYSNGLADISLDGEVLPGYYEMWFSWVNSNEGTKNIWKK